MTTAIFIIISNNKTPQSLNRRHLAFPCTRVDTMADSSQLTQGGSKVRRSCQSTIVEAVCTELRHSDRNLRTAWFEKGDFKTGIFKKNTGWIFIIIGWMCTHTSNTYLCSNNLKVNFASNDPFKKQNNCLLVNVVDSKAFQKNTGLYC